MHTLIVPERLTPEQALQRCERYLAQRWRLWRPARLLLPRKNLPDVVALATWHEFLRERMAGDQSDLRLRDLDELVEVLETVFSTESGTPPPSALGLTLSRTVRQHQLPALLFRGPLEEYRRCEQVSAFETRGVLLTHARKLSQPLGRMLLSIHGAGSERNEVLIDSLGLGIQLTRWLADFRRDLERGKLHVAVEDVVRHGVDIRDLREARIDEHSRELFADQIAWARSYLERGWPLCAELGPWRGRQLAFLLRWHAATLTALEARHYDALAGPPPAGLLRLVACGAVSLATAEGPRFSA